MGGDTSRVLTIVQRCGLASGSSGAELRRMVPRIDITRIASVWSPPPPRGSTRVTAPYDLSPPHSGLERGCPMFKLTPIRIAAVSPLPCGLALGSPRPVPADVQPGDTITKANQDKIKGLVADGVQWCVNRGMEMKIVPA